MAAQYPVKAFLAEEVRRFTCSENTFAGLQAGLLRVFGLPSGTEAVVKYADEDNELITMSSDMELDEALRSRGTGALRVTLVVKGAVPPPAYMTQTFAPPSPQPVVQPLSQGYPSSPGYPQLSQGYPQYPQSPQQYPQSMVLEKSGGGGYPAGQAQPMAVEKKQQKFEKKKEKARKKKEKTETKLKEKGEKNEQKFKKKQEKKRCREEKAKERASSGYVSGSESSSDEDGTGERKKRIRGAKKQLKLEEDEMKRLVKTQELLNEADLSALKVASPDVAATLLQNIKERNQAIRRAQDAFEQKEREQEALIKQLKKENKEIWRATKDGIELPREEYIQDPAVKNQIHTLKQDIKLLRRQCDSDVLELERQIADLEQRIKARKAEKKAKVVAKKHELRSLQMMAPTFPNQQQPLPQ